LPLVTFGYETAAIISVYALGTGAVAYGALFLTSVGLIDWSTPPSTGCSSGASVTAPSR
jgi:hypothetical protein